MHSVIVLILILCNFVLDVSNVEMAFNGADFEIIDECDADEEDDINDDDAS